MGVPELYYFQPPVSRNPLASAGGGRRNRGTKDLSVREWTCPECGVTHDRDKNAARNEVNWYYEFVRYNTDAISEIYAGGDEISTLGLRSKCKSCQGNQKSYGTIDSVSPCL